MYEEEFLVETLNSAEVKEEEKARLRHFLDALVIYGLEDYAI